MFKKTALATALITTVMTGNSYAGNYPEDTSSKAKAMFVNKVAKYDGDACKAESPMEVAGAQMKLANERDYTGDDISAADDANEVAIKKVGRKAWCKKVAAEFKKFQPAAADKPASYFPNMTTEKKVTMLITIKMHGAQCNVPQSPTTKAFYAIIASELTPKDLPRSKIDAIADVYNAAPAQWCEGITKVLENNDATINGLMAK